MHNWQLVCNVISPNEVLACGLRVSGVGGSIVLRNSKISDILADLSRVRLCPAIRTVVYAAKGIHNAERVSEI